MEYISLVLTGIIITVVFIDIFLNHREYLYININKLVRFKIILTLLYLAIVLTTLYFLL